MWLIVQLTGSGVSVGLTAGLQFLPILLFGAWGGLLADRMPKRRLLMITQSLMALPALALWALTTSGSIEVWMVYALVLVRGAVQRRRQPGAPELRDRDGRRRPRGQRGRPELGDRPHARASSARPPPAS